MSFYIPIKKWTKTVANEAIKDIWYTTSLVDFPQEPDARIYGTCRFNRGYRPDNNEVLIPMRYTVTYDIVFKEKKLLRDFNMPAMGL